MVMSEKWCKRIARLTDGGTSATVARKNQLRLYDQKFTLVV
jgi:hypothetical protein